MSEIDELGSSLLNRQRANVDRTDKRLRRNVRNQAALALASKGVQLVNSALKNRADTFVNQNEDLIGQRVLYKSALGDRQAILDDYAAGQAYAGGMEEYLTSKFLPDTTQAITLNVDDEVYTEDSIGKLALVKAREAAKEYQPQFETAYKAALNMPELDDYDAFVATQTRGKKATNVGNFLVNSVLRNINEQTPEDTDKQIVDAVLNSRFGENAKAVKNAKSLMDKGYSNNKAARLAQDIEDVKNNGLESVGVTFISAKPIVKDVINFGRPAKVTIMESTYRVAKGGTITIEEPFFNFDPETGERSYTISDAAKKDYLKYNSDSNNIPFDYIDGLTKQDLADFNIATEARPLDPNGTRVATYGLFNEPGTLFQTAVYDRSGNVLTVTTDRFIPDSVMSFSEQMAKIDPSLVAEQQGIFQESLGNTFIGTGMFGGNKNPFTEEVILTALSGSADAGEILMEENKEELIASILNPKMKRLAVESQNFLERHKGLDDLTAKRLNGISLAQSIKSGLRDDNQKFNQDSKFLNVVDFKYSLMLYGDAELDELNIGSRLEIPETTYQEMVINALQEVEPMPNNDEFNNNRREARRLLASSQEFINTRIRTDSLDFEGIPLDGDNEYITAGELLEALDNLGNKKEDPTDPNVLDGYTRFPPNTEEERKRKQQEEARELVQSTLGETKDAKEQREAAEEQERLTLRNNAAATEIKTFLDDKKLPPKNSLTSSTQIKYALDSNILTDLERKVLTAYLEEDNSPK